MSKSLKLFTTIDYNKIMSTLGFRINGGVLISAGGGWLCGEEGGRGGRVRKNVLKNKPGGGTYQGPESRNLSLFSVKRAKRKLLNSYYLD